MVPTTLPKIIIIFSFNSAVERKQPRPPISKILYYMVVSTLHLCAAVYASAIASATSDQLRLNVGKPIRSSLNV